MTVIDRLEALLASGTDNAQLRFGLASAYMKQNKAREALEHASLAVDLDADYSAAWRLLGQIQARLGLEKEAADTFARGIEVAEHNGDAQLVKEMRVFLKRLSKNS
jgi:Tfp pilus assembly protein PilF